MSPPLGKSGFAPKPFFAHPTGEEGFIIMYRVVAGRQCNAREVLRGGWYSLCMSTWEVLGGTWYSLHCHARSLRSGDPRECCRLSGRSHGTVGNHLVPMPVSAHLIGKGGPITIHHIVPRRRCDIREVSLGRWCGANPSEAGHLAMYDG